MSWIYCLPMLIYMDSNMILTVLAAVWAHLLRGLSLSPSLFDVFFFFFLTTFTDMTCFATAVRLFFWSTFFALAATSSRAFSLAKCNWAVRQSQALVSCYSVGGGEGDRWLQQLLTMVVQEEEARSMDASDPTLLHIPNWDQTCIHLVSGASSV